jgi:hypothetical protein
MQNKYKQTNKQDTKSGNNNNNKVVVAWEGGGLLVGLVQMMFAIAWEEKECYTNGPLGFKT